MKIALCFIINYDHILNKEALWREWIESNKDIINVYFYYKDLTKIQSSWILDHAIPEKYIFETSYYHVIPAYTSSINYALTHDRENQWFCLLTDSCCPIISPKRFRYLFYKYYNNSIMSWRKAWWNIQFHKRANLALLPEELRLANDPWFILNRQNVIHCIKFIKAYPDLVNTISSGGLANESLFAIAMYICNQLQNKNVICGVTHLTDWSRMASPTSPHLFKEANNRDIKFIDDSLETNKYAAFIRKIAPEFPDDVLRKYIFEQDDSDLVIIEPSIVIYKRYKRYVIYYLLPVIGFVGFLYLFFRLPMFSRSFSS
jgi:hypothetical protein